MKKRSRHTKNKSGRNKNHQVRRFLIADVTVVLDMHGVVQWKVKGPRGATGWVSGHQLTLDFSGLTLQAMYRPTVDDRQVDLGVAKTIGRSNKSFGRPRKAAEKGRV